MSEKQSLKTKLNVYQVRLKKAHEALWFVLTVCPEAGHLGLDESGECVSCEVVRKAKAALNINS